MRRIEPPGKFPKIIPDELWKFREVLYFFLWRDIKLRYKQTKFGKIWIIIQPLITMVIFTVFFGMIIKVPSGDIPYHLFFLSAYIPWILASEGVSRSTSSIIANANIINKTYIPKVILPVSGVLSPIVDFCIAFCLLLGAMIVSGYIPTLNIVWLPLFIILTVITALGIGFWFSALSVRYRDWQFIVPISLQMWSYASPMVYPSDLVPLWIKWFYDLNPMVGIMEAFRWMLFGGVPYHPSFYWSIVVAIVIFVSGYLYFRKSEHAFVDVV